MIYVIGRKDFPKYDKEGVINLTITPIDDQRFKLLGLLTPTEDLVKVWKQSDGSAESWEAFKQGYLEELSSSKGQAGIELLSFYSRIGKTINLICPCSDPDRCVRSIISEVLIELGNDVFLERSSRSKEAVPNSNTADKKGISE